jgi:CubicO group peptidase (beta-lactamase class C family)
VYCSINRNLLGAVLAASTKRPMRELFAELFADAAR